MEQLSLRDTEIAIAESQTLQRFCRLDKKETISFQLIDQAHLALKPETWQSLNQFFAARMVAEEKINPEYVENEVMRLKLGGCLSATEVVLFYKMRRKRGFVSHMIALAD